MRNLVAEDYEYSLPDHWVGHATTPNIPFFKMHNYYASRVVQLVKEHGARTVLEAGCGDGWITAKLAQAGFDAIGIDWSKNAIAHAQNLAPFARFHCGDVRDEEFLSRFPEKFDAVVLVEVIEHIPPADTIDALRNILSRLSPGGIFVLTTPHTNFPNNNPEHYRHFKPEELMKILSQVGGMSVRSSEGYGDVIADKTYWRWRRLIDNPLFQIKPLVRRLDNSLKYDRPTSFDRCHGIILTAIKDG